MICAASAAPCAPGATRWASRCSISRVAAASGSSRCRSRRKKSERSARGPRRIGKAAPLTPGPALAAAVLAASFTAAPLGVLVAQEERGSGATAPEFRSPARLPEVEPGATREAAAGGSESAATPSPSGGRIFGGTAVPAGAAPWQAEIYRQISDERWARHLRDHPQEKRPKWELQHWCGAALIADDWVLTAAPCLLVHQAHSDPLLKAEYAARRAQVTVSRDRQVTRSAGAERQPLIQGFRV